jgi:hypothetical protein
MLEAQSMKFVIKDGQLRRVGATTHCVGCGLPPPWLNFAHIHEQDLHLSDGDPCRVFRLCWNHHHGAYAYYQISTRELLECERIWIEEPEHRPQPHPRDNELVQRLCRLRAHRQGATSFAEDGDQCTAPRRSGRRKHPLELIERPRATDGAKRRDGNDPPIDNPPDMAAMTAHCGIQW